MGMPDVLEVTIIGGKVSFRRDVVKIVAHRGFNGRFPEMTEVAYRRALELPIHGVECDIRLTKDGHLVCLHDKSLLRLGGVLKLVEYMTLDQIRKICISDDTCEEDSFHCAITLEELLDMVFETEDKHIYIEPKHPSFHGGKLERTLVAVLKKKDLLESDRVHVIGFSHKSMMRIHRHAPKLETFYLRRDWERKVNKKDLVFSRPSGTGVSLAFAKLRPSILESKHNVRYMYTVNGPEDMIFARDNDVDIMATDFPDVALETVGAEG